MITAFGKLITPYTIFTTEMRAPFRASSQTATRARSAGLRLDFGRPGISTIGLVVAILALLSTPSDCSREGSKETSSRHRGLDVEALECPIGDPDNGTVRLEIGIRSVI